MEKSEQDMTAFEVLVKRKKILRQLDSIKDDAKYMELTEEAHRLARLAYKKGGINSQEEMYKLSVQ